MPARTMALAVTLLAVATATHTLRAQDAPDVSSAPIERHAPAKAAAAGPPAQAPGPPAQASGPPAQTPEPLPAPPPYDPAIFQHTLAPADLAFLKTYSGATTNELVRDKQFHKILKQIVPDCMFHYGRDMSLDQALETVLSGSAEPVQVRDDRYVLLSGHMGPYLGGRGFLWIDTQAGVGLGGFFFRPTNGEPSPTVTVFSRLIREPDGLGLSELPPEFRAALTAWDLQANVPLLTTRYFISSANRRILLEHDEDFCQPTSNAAEVDDCLQMNSDAADTDLNTAYYLEQIHYATNGTAWMIKDPDEADFIVIRDRTCGRGPDPVACRIRLTRERIHVVTHRPALKR